MLAHLDIPIIFRFYYIDTIFRQNVTLREKNEKFLFLRPKVGYENSYFGLGNGDNLR